MQGPVRRPCISASGPTASQPRCVRAPPDTAGLSGCSPLLSGRRGRKIRCALTAWSGPADCNDPYGGGCCRGHRQGGKDARARSRAGGDNGDRHPVVAWTTGDAGRAPGEDEHERPDDGNEKPDGDNAMHEANFANTAACSLPIRSYCRLGAPIARRISLRLGTIVGDMSTASPPSVLRDAWQKLTRRGSETLKAPTMLYIVAVCPRLARRCT